MGAAYRNILFEVADGIATVTLNRPEKLNAYTLEMGDEIVDAFAKIRSERSPCASRELPARPRLSARASMGCAEGASGKRSASSEPQREKAEGRQAQRAARRSRAEAEAPAMPAP